MDATQPSSDTSLSNRMSLKTIIVDDEKLARDLLKAWVSRHPDLEFVADFSSGLEARQWLTHHSVDLLLLDIQMPDLTGVELAEQLIAQSHMPYVIFCTAYQQHAIKAFELSAVDYLVKPIEKNRFHSAIDKAVRYAKQQQLCDLAQQLVAISQSITPGDNNKDEISKTLSHAPINVRRGDEIIQLLPDEILWVEAASQYVYLHSTHGRFMLSETLSSFSVHLPTEDFIRVHRSALVNTKCIQKVIQKPNKLYAVVLSNGEDIPIARSRKDLLPILISHAKQTKLNEPGAPAPAS